MAPGVMKNIIKDEVPQTKAVFSSLLMLRNSREDTENQTAAAVPVQHLLSPGEGRRRAPAHCGREERIPGHLSPSRGCRFLQPACQTVIGRTPRRARDQCRRPQAAARDLG